MQKNMKSKQTKQPKLNQSTRPIPEVLYCKINDCRVWVYLSKKGAGSPHDKPHIEYTIPCDKTSLYMAYTTYESHVLSPKISPSQQAKRWIRENKLDLATALITIMEEHPFLMKKVEEYAQKARRKI